jgi:hypothetical protein
MEGIDKLSTIPPYIRRRIVTFSESGLNDTLIREDNVQISRPGISLFLKRYNATGVIDDQIRGNCANVRKKLTDEHLRFFDNTMSDDRERILDFSAQRCFGTFYSNSSNCHFYGIKHILVQVLNRRGFETSCTPVKDLPQKCPVFLDKDLELLLATVQFHDKAFSLCNHKVLFQLVHIRKLILMFTLILCRGT